MIVVKYIATGIYGRGRQSDIYLDPYYSLLHLQPLVTNFFGQRAYSVAYVITQMLRVQSLVAIQGCKNQEKP